MKSVLSPDIGRRFSHGHIITVPIIKKINVYARTRACVSTSKMHGPSVAIPASLMIDFFPTSAFYIFIKHALFESLNELIYYQANLSCIFSLFICILLVYKCTLPFKFNSYFVLLLFKWLRIFGSITRIGTGQFD